MEQTDYQPRFPLFCDLRGKNVVVVGAGTVAQRKIEALLYYGALPSVITPSATEAVVGLAREGRVRLALREFSPADVRGAFLVIGATSDKAVNARVAECAARENALVNIVDEPQLCNFFIPSQVRRGPLQIAVSTSGASPSLARRIREDLEDEYPESWSGYTALLGMTRDLLKRELAGSPGRRRAAMEMLASGDLRKLLFDGGLGPCEVCDILLSRIPPEGGTDSVA